MLLANLLKKSHNITQFCRRTHHIIFLIIVFCFVMGPVIDGGNDSSQYYDIIYSRTKIQSIVISKFNKNSKNWFQNTGCVNLQPLVFTIFKLRLVPTLFPIFSKITRIIYLKTIRLIL